MKPSKFFLDLKKKEFIRTNKFIISIVNFQVTINISFLSPRLYNSLQSRWKLREIYSSINELDKYSRRISVGRERRRSSKFLLLDFNVRPVTKR